MPPRPRRLIEGQAPEELLHRRADHDTIAEQLVPAGRIARDTRFLEEADCEVHQARFQQLLVLFEKQIPLRKKCLSSPAMSSTPGRKPCLDISVKELPRRLASQRLR